MSAGIAARRLRGRAWRDIGFRWYLLLVPAACYFAASLMTRANAGERHVLPLLLFLFVFMAALLAGEPVSRWRLIPVAAACLALIAEGALIYPHYLAFFNALAGGPAGGSEFLADSNLDWGQDARNLKDYLDAHRIGEACVSYFGRADLDYYGIRHRELRGVPSAAAADRLDCVAAVSVSHLVLIHQDFAGLDEVEPDARIGYSINIYDLRKRR
jgi:hypothetical protein